MRQLLKAFVYHDPKNMSFDQGMESTVPFRANMKDLLVYHCRPENGLESMIISKEMKRYVRAYIGSYREWEGQDHSGFRFEHESPWA